MADQPPPLHNVQDVRAAFALCALYPNGVKPEYADYCINALEAGANKGYLREFSRIMLALRGENPEHPKGDLTIGNMPSTVTKISLTNGANQDALAVCPVSAPCTDRRNGYSLDEIKKVFSTDDLIARNVSGNEPLMVGARTAAVFAYISAYENPDKYFLRTADGSGMMTLAQTVAEFRKQHPDAQVAGKLNACFRQEVTDVKQCASAGVRHGMYQRAGRAQAHN